MEHIAFKSSLDFEFSCPISWLAKDDAAKPVVTSRGSNLATSKSLMTLR